MHYPFNLLVSDLEIHPIIDTHLWLPFLFDYTDQIFWTLPIRDTAYMQKWNEEILRLNKKQWWIAWYLEDRSLRLAWTHLVSSGRTYHIWIDIIAAAGVELHSPLDGEIIESSYEEGKANYGWYIVVAYTLMESTFYVLFWHLDPKTSRRVGSVKKGEVFGTIWSAEVNGDWTTHTHMQVFTGKEFETWKSKGYCTLEDMKTIQQICPDPSFLLRYS